VPNLLYGLGSEKSEGAEIEMTSELNYLLKPTKCVGDVIDQNDNTSARHSDGVNTI